MSRINLFEGEISNDQVPPLAWRVHSANIHLQDRYSSVEWLFIHLLQECKALQTKFNKPFNFVQPQHLSITLRAVFFTAGCEVPHHDKQHVMQGKEHRHNTSHTFQPMALHDFYEYCIGIFKVEQIQTSVLFELTHTHTHTHTHTQIHIYIYTYILYIQTDSFPKIIRY